MKDYLKDYNLKSILAYILVFEAFGFISGYLIGYSSDMFAIQSINFYVPPSYVFGIVWTILYAALGFIAYLIFNYAPTSIKVVFTVHMVLNYAWSYVFFSLDYYAIGFVICVLLVVTLLYISPWLKDTNKLAYILSIVYLLWLLYASWLNLLVVVAM